MRARAKARERPLRTKEGRLTRGINVAATTTKTKKRKEKKSVYEGNVYIQATFNNTIVTGPTSMETRFHVRVPEAMNPRRKKVHTICCPDGD
jgi:hypothetical protein